LRTTGALPGQNFSASFYSFHAENLLGQSKGMTTAEKNLQKSIDI